MKKWPVSLLLAVALFMGAFATNTSAGGSPSNIQVYEVSFNGAFVEPTQVNESDEVVTKGKFTTANIINLALGQADNAMVATNVKLALIFAFFEDADPEVALIVYDTTVQDILVGIADMDLGGAVDSTKGKGIVGMAGGLESVGHITNGWLAITGKVVLNPTTPDTMVKSFSAKAVQGIIRGAEGENSFEYTITRGKMTVVRQLEMGTVFSK